MRLRRRRVFPFRGALAGWRETRTRTVDREPDEATIRRHPSPLGRVELVLEAARPETRSALFLLTEIKGDELCIKRTDVAVDL